MPGPPGPGVVVPGTVGPGTVVAPLLGGALVEGADGLVVAGDVVGGGEPVVETTPGAAVSFKVL